MRRLDQLEQCRGRVDCDKKKNPDQSDCCEYQAAEPRRICGQIARPNMRRRAEPTRDGKVSPMFATEREAENEKGASACMGGLAFPVTCSVPDCAPPARVS
jgi:hypothetical protein